MNYHKAIRDYIVSNFLYGDATSLQDDTSFLDSGVIDSTGVLELVAFLEQNFHIQVLEAEMIPENLDSVNRLSHFVAGKSPEKVSINGGGTGEH